MKSSEKVLIALLAFKRTTGLVLILAVVLAIPVTLALTQRSQSLQQRAAEITPTTPVNDIQISPDVNGDGLTNTADYNMILRCMNTNYCEIQMVDLNGDGIISRADYELLLSKYLDAQ